MNDYYSDGYHSDGDYDSGDSMDNAQIDLNYEHWLQEDRNYLQEDLETIGWQGNSTFSITLQRLKLLTRQPQLLESLLRTVNNLPAGTIQELDVNMDAWQGDDPFDEQFDDFDDEAAFEDALDATATELAGIMSGDSVERLYLRSPGAFI